jgi:hypothetical protein
MKEQFEPQKDIFIRHRHLIEWVQKNGGYLHPTAQIAFTSRKGFHALVMEGERLEAGSRVVGCPMPLTISVLNALDITPFSSNGSRFPKEFLHSQISQPESLQAFFLMEQLVLGNKSWWNPYIAALPTVQEIADSQFQSEEDLRWLDGTNLRTALDTHVGKWRAMYVTGMAQLKALGWSRISEGSYTWFVDLGMLLVTNVLIHFTGNGFSGQQQCIVVDLSLHKSSRTRYQQIKLECNIINVMTRSSAAAE